jgi:hypothetical protein
LARPVGLRSIGLRFHATLSRRRRCAPLSWPAGWRRAIVASPRRTRYDQFGKQLIRAALEGRGSVETDVEVPVETQRIDIWFTPDAARAEAFDDLGLLGRIISGPGTAELFHNTPSGDDLTGCLAKHREFRHLLPRRKAQPPLPMHWVISSGRPDGAIEGLGFLPMPRWPSGVYECPPLLWTRLVVVNELPVVRDTLLLRVLGAGSVLKQAIAELRSLSAEAPERTLALPVLLRLRLGMPNDPALQTRDDQEFLMDTHDVVEAWRREAIQEGVRQGREEGVRQGREEGVRQGREEGVQQGREQGVQQGREQGVQQGREQGVQQGLEQGERKLLLSQLRCRFGNQVDGETERRLEAASVAQIEGWAVRVFSAATLAELLDD